MAQCFSQSFTITDIYAIASPAFNYRHAYTRETVLNIVLPECHLGEYLINRFIRLLYCRKVIRICAVFTALIYVAQNLQFVLPVYIRDRTESPFFSFDMHNKEVKTVRFIKSEIINQVHQIEWQFLNGNTQSTTQNTISSSITFFPPFSSLSIYKTNNVT